MSEPRIPLKLTEPQIALLRGLLQGASGLYCGGVRLANKRRIAGATVRATNELGLTTYSGAYALAITNKGRAELSLHMEPAKQSGRQQRRA